MAGGNATPIHAPNSPNIVATIIISTVTFLLRVVLLVISTVVDIITHTSRALSQQWEEEQIRTRLNVLPNAPASAGDLTPQQPPTASGSGGFYCVVKGKQVGVFDNW
jgi:hypothetical protein